ncbi:MAG: ceramide glucosyltransferase [Paracoccus sp. (in: a-proteobacteria)]|uniref:ceramide glucosyltransferase n=1 Tax=Paracoccus sp. TaxID=267 RepID=UPI0026DFEE8E|nr:ceramide glucosyltransferase [Paracoccus sp. (in: a-proteobacteria)]MDO5611776.1 ceramide glucosyltransferase [Paracoccus sp. (in: a-proteobacteria)]
MSILTTVLLLIVLAALGLHLFNVLVVTRRLSVPPEAVAPQDMPPVTLLRPVCGLEYALERNLESAFQQDTPGYELIHCADDPDDAAIPVLRRLMERYPHVNARLMIGRNPVCGNPKLNNLVKGWAECTGDWVVIADSNLLLPPDYLRQVLACRASGVGMVSSPGVGVDAHNFWARVEAAFLNSFQARWLLGADSLGIGFAQGKTLAYPREWLSARGGMMALAGKKAEDVASTHLIRGEGLRVRTVRRPFTQLLGQRTAGEVWKRQARWAQLRREGFPTIYPSEPLSGPVANVAMLAVAWPGAILPFLLIWYGSEWFLARCAGWGHSAADVLAWVVRDLWQLPMWAKGWRDAPIVWRGNVVTETPGGGAQGGQGQG